MTYTEFRGGIDELEVNLLKVSAGSVDHERLANGDYTLLDSRNGTLEHDVVVPDNTVVGEATHGCNCLLGNVVLSRSVTFIVTLANAIDLLVEFSTMVVTVCRIMYITMKRFVKHLQPKDVL